MIYRALAAFFTLAALASCSSFPVIGSLSPQKGYRDARCDIKAQTLQICYAGTRGSFPVGVDESQLYLIETLPKKSIPVGCNDPNAQAAIGYAKAYNQQIILYLLAAKKQKAEQGTGANG